MRVFSTFVLLAKTVQTVFGKGTASQNEAVVFMSPFEEQEEVNVPVLDTAEARAVFSHALKVTKFQQLPRESSARHVINSVLNHPSQLNSLFYGHDRNVFLTVSGVPDAKSMYIDEAPAFTIASSPSSGAYGELLLRYMNQMDSVTGEATESAYSNEFGGSVYVHPASEAENFQIKPKSVLKKFKKLFDEETVSFFDVEKRQDRAFLSEAVALAQAAKHLRSMNEMSKNTSVVIIGQLNSLDVLYSYYGAKSTQFLVARHCISTLLNSLKQYTTQSTVVLLPASTQSVWERKRRDDVSAFEVNELTNTSIGLAAAEEEASRKESARFASSCYSTRASCEKATNMCSGHGTCQLYLGHEGCYACQCEATVNITASGGRRTQNWGGADCSKKDVSVAAQFFVWFTVIGLALLVYCMKLLFDLGQEDLASVLTTTTAITKKNN
ncbi:fungal protein [Schizosaccharomyces japonicus yFS275]|uniref:Fungal protein n=1 Tax=Schizosaccharomyces japonicus (strain yFS275 / FY16936) TaxID=402676 RepID=B6K3P9_SCHJY|nr:fungal protein [Schizosaccharomyces japonicus yFS275]EEB08106.2 fungal protein [Schizosaccharomyces japonicus yFS275]